MLIKGKVKFAGKEKDIGKVKTTKLKGELKLHYIPSQILNFFLKNKIRL